MMGLDEFTTATARCVRHRQLLARAALNSLGFADEFPVDISELRVLSCEGRGQLMEFLSWVVGQPRRFSSSDELTHLKAIAQRCPGSSPTCDPGASQRE